MAWSARTRARLILGCGAAAGLLMAASDLLQAPASRGGVPAEAAAVVNGRTIRRDALERALAALASDRREPLGSAERTHVLERLIDEELLVQRALELGLAESDRRVRGDLVAAMIGSVTIEASTREPTSRDLEEFFSSHREYFRRPGRLRARQIFVRTVDGSPDAEARSRADEATQRLRAGEDFASVRSALGDAEVVPLPDTPLPVEKLRDYLGPTAVTTLLGLTTGQVSDPIRSTSGYVVLELVEQTDAEIPALAEVEPQVRAALRNESGDDALRRYLEDLRRSGQVLIAEDPS